MKIYRDIEEHIIKCVEACELTLYGTELLPGSSQHTLRIFIDKPGQVTADDCQQVGQYLRHYASVHCPSLGQYLIEVSSPGLDRILFTLEHVEAQIGKRVKCKLRSAIENRRNFTGTLTGIQDSNILMDVDNSPVTLTWDNIEKIRLIYQPEGHHEQRWN